MDRVVRTDHDGTSYFQTPEGIVYIIKDRIGSPSVNSVAYKVVIGSRPATRARNKKYFVLKLSLLDTAEKKRFFDNKVWIHKTMAKIAKKHANVRSKVSIATDTGLLEDMPVAVGYVVEPFLEGYDDFEVACLKWAKECGPESKMCRTRFIKNIIQSFVQLAILLKFLYREFGFNHNDMHTRNFMVRENADDDGVSIKLIDFDWSTFHDNHHDKNRLPETHPQSVMMSGSYYAFFEKMRNHLGMDRGEYAAMCADVKNRACAAQLFKEGSRYYKGKPCEILHFAIHLLYSYEYFVSDLPSPSVDLAKLCSDFGKKFLDHGRCTVFDTDFDTQDPDVVLARKLLRTAEARPLRQLVRDYEEDHYRLVPPGRNDAMSLDMASAMNVNSRRVR